MDNRAAQRRTMPHPPWSPGERRLFSHSFGHFQGACLLLLIFLICGLTWAQIPLPVPPKPAPEAEIPKDALGRTTPRGTVRGFLNASHKGAEEVAIQYLNTPLRGSAATALARKLFVVLDRRLPARLNELAEQPEGSLSDPLHPNQDLVGTIRGVNGDVDIVLERVDRKGSAPVWLFSRKTLESIPALYEEVNAISVENVLPAVLVNTRIAGIRLFEWLAVLLGMPLVYFLTGLLGRMLGSATRTLLRLVGRKSDLHNRQILPRPIRLLLLALVIRWLLSTVNLPLLARQFWSDAAAVITTAALVWLLILLNSRAEQYISQRLYGRRLAGAGSMLRLIRRLVDFLIIFGGGLQVLHHFRINPTAALAGLGLGGIAIALAAQKTLENIVGGISLILDQAVRVGEMIRVGATEGIIDEIGLRSTRIRTLDRTMLSIPNGQIASLTVENLSARDKFWLHPIIGLRYGTTSEQMHIVLEGIHNLLAQSSHVEGGTFRARLLRFGPSSLEIEVFAYIFARDVNNFLEVQEVLLLRIMECVESAGAQIALPSQTIFLAPAATSDNGPPAIMETVAADKQFSQEVAAPTQKSERLPTFR
jgi:MscS family membrane protein